MTSISDTVGDDTSFTLFSKLPAEIRLQIWKEAVTTQCESRFFELLIKDESEFVPQSYIKSLLQSHPEVLDELYHQRMAETDREQALRDEIDAAEPPISENEAEEECEDEEDLEDVDENDGAPEDLEHFRHMIEEYTDIPYDPFWPEAPGDSDDEDEHLHGLEMDAPAPVSIARVSCPRRIPAMLLVSSEARNIAKDFYTRIEIAGTVVYADFSRDGIFIGGDTYAEHIPSLLQEFGAMPFYDQVQQLAMTLNVWDVAEDAYAEMWLPMVLGMKSLEVLCIVKEKPYTVLAQDEVDEGEIIDIQPLTNPAKFFPGLQIKQEIREYLEDEDMTGPNAVLGLLDRCGKEKRRRFKEAMKTKHGHTSLEKVLARAVAGVPQKGRDEE